MPTDRDTPPYPVDGWQDPCADPVTALEWNVDALASSTAKEFARLAALAGENGLNYRERGAYIFMRPDGSIGVGRIYQSEPFAQDGDNTNVSVPLAYDDIPDPNWIIGSIHSHPVANHRPSGVGPDGDRRDLAHFDSVVSIMDNYGRDSTGARIYIVSQNQLGAGQAPYNQINVYTKANIQASQSNFQVGPEVNPEAQPCS